jgi:endonuclease/exonuclease/phosphatase family metal-dependent hydrolase
MMPSATGIFRRRALGGWLLALVFVLPAPLRAQTPDADTPTVTVCSYNIYNWLKTDRPVDGKFLKDAPKPEAEKKAVASILREINADILALLEVGRDPIWAADLTAYLKKSGLDYPHRTFVSNTDPRIGILLLSRHPITRNTPRTNDTFSLRNEQYRVGRGFIDVDIAVTPTYSLTILAGHLKSKRPLPKDQPAESMIRRNEAIILRSYFEEKLEKDPEANILLMGDFNDTPNSITVRTLTGARSDSRFRSFDLWVTDYLGDRWTHYFTPEHSYSRIDYMVASPGLFREYLPARSYVYREKPGAPPHLRWNQASDHRPVVATFIARDLPASASPSAEPMTAPGTVPE